MQREQCCKQTELLVADVFRVRFAVDRLEPPELCAAMKHVYGVAAKSDDRMNGLGLLVA